MTQETCWTLATDCGQTALAFGADGTCWLAFTVFGVGTKVSRRDPVTGTWTGQVVDPTQIIGGLSAMRVDAAGLPSLGYSGRFARKLP